MTAFNGFIGLNWTPNTHIKYDIHPFRVFTSEQIHCKWYSQKGCSSIASCFIALSMLTYAQIDYKHYSSEAYFLN